MKVYFDGGCVPNPGKMSVCAVFEKYDGHENGRTYSNIGVGQGTNNIAEWTALIWACQLAVDNGIKDISLIGDSKLVVMQANGLWKIKHKDFLPFKEEYDLLIKSFNSVSLTHVLREHNLAGHYLEDHGT